ncbi:MAG: DNA polymerase III subunit delta [Candidatus Aminicenantaceae bacterium]
MRKEINEKNLHLCYFFFGEETFLASQFIQELKGTLISPDIQEYNVERFNLNENSWAEIIDLARTIPFFFSPWRIITVEVSEGYKKNLTPYEERMLKDYFSSVPGKTVLVIICSGKIHKNHSLFKFFSSLPPSLIFQKEMKPLKGKELHAWMDRKFASEGKSATHDAKRRLMEIKGNNLRSLDNELDKLTVFVGDKKIVELDDVNQISGWGKTFVEWELSNSLENVDFEQSLIVLNNLFKEGIKPEYIVGIIAKFFHDIFLAKLWLKEKSRDKKTIFQELRPHISERFGSFYRTKFKEFFFLVESISQNDLNHILKELEKIDLSIKTSDVACQPLLERFLFAFCSIRKEGNLFGRRGID